MQQKLTYQAASEYASQLHNASTNVDTIVNNIRQQFAHVGDLDYWAGDVANETAAQFKALAEKLTDFMTVLTEEANHLDKVVAEYQAADARVNAGLQ